MNNLKVCTERMKFDDDYANAAEAMSKNPMSDAEKPSSGGGNESKSMWGLLRKQINDKKKKYRLRGRSSETAKAHRG
eukprot:TRINITY_DN2366_c0_g1_i1.p1 TRINITY_DN2366_c0_g1~~TRINITY_DN2366_c0_g1_i1.p1  ORF type:complete len:77 (+),score=47.27 TRINITY_DN2366_c0_g1_i1:55-285(+)